MRLRKLMINALASPSGDSHSEFVLPHLFCGAGHAVYTLWPKASLFSHTPLYQDNVSYHIVSIKMLKPVKGADLADLSHESTLPVSLTTHGLKVTAAFQTLDCQLAAERHSLSKASREWNVMIPPTYPFLCPADPRTAKPVSCHCWQEPV